MRVLMLVATSVDTDTRVRKEAAALAGAGHRVHIVGRMVPPGFVPIPGVVVYSVDSGSALRPTGAPSLGGGGMPAYTRVLRWALLPEHRNSSFRRWAAGAVEQAKSLDFDVVHAHDFSALRAGAELAALRSVPLIYDSHEYWPGRTQAGRPTVLQRRRERRAEHRLGSAAAAVITVGDGVAAALRRDYGWTHVYVVRNTFPAAATAPPVLRRPRGVVYAGRLDAFRELDIVAEAAQRAAVPLTMLGPSDTTWLAGFNHRGATVLPALPVDEVDAVLRREGVALVTLSDSSENHRLALPNKLFHAVRAGVPVIATDIGELGATVRRYGIGALYRPGDVGSLVEALRETWQRYTDFAANVRRCADELSWERDEQTLLAVYADVATRRQAPPHRHLGRPAVSVVSAGHDVADARLHREVAALQRTGLSVEIIALGNPADAPVGTYARCRPRGSMTQRAARCLWWPWRARGHVLMTLGPDVVPSALVVRAVRRRRLVADLPEDYVALLTDRAWVQPWLRRPLQGLAAWCVGLAGHADLTSVADDHVPPAAQKCRRRIVVRNYPERADLPSTAALPDSPPLRAVYVGDIRASRGLREMLEAVAAARRWSLDLVGPVAAEDAAWLRERLQRPDVCGRVVLHGRRPPRESWDIAAGCSVGFALLHATPAFVAAVPGKIYEYLAAGLAVLATPLPRVVPLLEASNAGRLVRTSTEAAAALTAWADDPDSLKASRRAAAAWAKPAFGQTSPWIDLSDQVIDISGLHGCPAAAG